MTELESQSTEHPMPKLVWIGCIIFVIAAALHSANRVVGGGDTWVAMECGRYTVGPWAMDDPGRTWQMKALDLIGIHITKVDPYSAKSRDYVPGDEEQFGWVNQNWLTHVMFYKMKSFFGEPDSAVSRGEVFIVWYKFIQALLTALFAYWAARGFGAHQLIASAIAGFGILLSRSFVDLRPNVSTIFFAAIMVYLLARWSKGHWKKLYWMTLVMIFWGNVHGGFIYGIVVMWVVAGSYAAMYLMKDLWGWNVDSASKEGYIHLLINAVLVTIIPMIFSPFGAENVLHPFIVMLGQEGDVWRDVVEWKPIWDSDGFGNVVPYVVFLIVFVAVYIAWFFIRLACPKVAVGKRKRQRQDEMAFDWPKFNLAWLGIIVLTLYMSITSRRFVFLGGIVLTPFLAMMIQNIFSMRRAMVQYRNNEPIEPKPMNPKTQSVFREISWIAAGLMLAIFSLAMWDLYIRDEVDGRDRTMFRKMVGINDQPERAMPFFDLNHIHGITFNEWTNGGFVAFGQSPNPDTGEPACKVFMDGRAQAAYVLEHFNYWKSLKAVVEDENAKKYYQVLTRDAKALGFEPTDPRFFDMLLERACSFYDSEKFGSKEQYDLYIRKSRTDVYYSLINHELLDNLFKRDGVTCAILSFSRSPELADQLMKSKNWELVYIDDRNVILLRKDAPENKELLAMNREDVKFPDETSRIHSLGYYYIRTRDIEQARKGVRLLMTAEEYIPKMYEYIYGYGRQIGLKNEIKTYFEEKYKEAKAQHEKNQRFGWLSNGVKLVHSTQILSIMAKEDGQTDQANKYSAEVKEYQKHYGIGKEYKGTVSIKMFGGILW